MYERIKIKLPSKFKILDKDIAFSWYEDEEAWSELDWIKKRTVLRSICFWDIKWFTQNIVPGFVTSKKTRERHEIPELHEELWSVSLEDGDLVVIVPRGFAKTTAISKILVLWTMLFEIEQSTLIISSRGLGEIIIGDIRRELETNTMITKLFGQLVPITARSLDRSEKWRQTELQLLNGVEVKTASKGQPIRGRRPTRVIIDDPEENKDVKNPVIANEFFEWVFNTVYSAIDDGGSMVVLGTVISENCFVNRLYKEADERGFRAIKYPAIYDFDWNAWNNSKDLTILERYDLATKNATCLWPSRWTLAKLRVKLRKLKENAFLQEFMHKPYRLNGSPVFPGAKLIVKQQVMSEGNWTFYEHMIRKDEEDKDICWFAVIGVDIADGLQSGDFSVIAVREAKTLRLIAEFRGKVPQDKLAREVQFITEQLQDYTVCFERNRASAFMLEGQQYEWWHKTYRTQTMDKAVNKETEKIGWDTTAKSKVHLVNRLEAKMRKDFEVSEIGAEEIQNFYINEKGGMEAQSPHHDDTVIANGLTIIADDQGIKAPILVIF